MVNRVVPEDKVLEDALASWRGDRRRAPLAVRLPSRRSSSLRAPLQQGLAAERRASICSSTAMIRRKHGSLHREAGSHLAGALTLLQTEMITYRSLTQAFAQIGVQPEGVLLAHVDDDFAAQVVGGADSVLVPCWPPPWPAAPHSRGVVRWCPRSARPTTASTTLPSRN